MTQRSIDPERFRKGFLVIMALAISVLFLAMIRRFLTPLLLAAILSGLAYPLYQRLLGWFGGRRATASTVTLLIVVLVILVPVTGFLGIVAAQAVEVSQAVRPWVELQISQPNQLDRILGQLPFAEALAPYQGQIMSKLGELAGQTGTFLVNSLAALTRGTATFFFLLFIMLYAMFFFLIHGPALLDRILFYMPLSPADENRMVEKFVSVSRATIKGTLLIGIVQGGLAGLAFAVVGIEGAVFWGTIMAVLSIIPGLGTALVWVPAVVYLLVAGQIFAGLGLLVWCAGLVGTVDNFLRPWLVGRDTKMPDLLILLGTLGGILLLGAEGLIIGPIIAALFVTVWDIYGAAFRDLLPGPVPAGMGREGGEG